MRLTNRQNYPEALVRAIQNDSYSIGEKADYSVTGLLKPVQQAILQRRYKDQIVEDVEDRIWSLYGQAVHTILERSNTEDLAEKRFYADFNGTIVTAQVDSLRLESGQLTDWKFQTVYKFKEGQPPDPDWTAQLNMQAEILRRNGLKVHSLQIVGLLRDWSKSKAKREKDKGYPQKQIVAVPIEMWNSETVTSFINLQIAKFEAAKDLPDHRLPACSQEERWADQDIYAVVKGSRAINGGLQYSEAAAQELVNKNPGSRIEFRPSESTRCLYYCSAAPFCQQFKKLYGEKK